MATEKVGERKEVGTRVALDPESLLLGVGHPGTHLLEGEPGAAGCAGPAARPSLGARARARVAVVTARRKGAESRARAAPAAAEAAAGVGRGSPGGRPRAGVPVGPLLPTRGPGCAGRGAGAAAGLACAAGVTPSVSRKSPCSLNPGGSGHAPGTAVLPGVEGRPPRQRRVLSP
uniref:elastin-like n=1 Tax=Panthera onca TaxID=9690 RepID=UPI00295445CE|nr:elastin-like [Panthera onca]